MARSARRVGFAHVVFSLVAVAVAATSIPALARKPNRVSFPGLSGRAHATSSASGTSRFRSQASPSAVTPVCSRKRQIASWSPSGEFKMPDPVPDGFLASPDRSASTS